MSGWLSSRESATSQAGIPTLRRVDSAKFEAFLDIARALNEIGITPPLCGSVGWEVVTGREWHPGDVDVHVPGDSRGWEAPDAEGIHQLDEIKQWMAALGYAYTDAHEHAFESPDGLRVEMGDPDELPSFAGVALENLAVAEDARARYGSRHVFLLILDEEVLSVWRIHIEVVPSSPRCLPEIDAARPCVVSGVSNVQPCLIRHHCGVAHPRLPGVISSNCDLRNLTFRIA